MNGELTLGDIYETIAERLAEARTKALMGEREEALGLFQGASLEYTRFHEVLKDYPGFHALEHAFTVTMESLCAEKTPLSEKEESGVFSPPAVKPRRRARKAA